MDRHDGNIYKLPTFAFDLQNLIAWLQFRMQTSKFNDEITRHRKAAFENMWRFVEMPKYFKFAKVLYKFASVPLLHELFFSIINTFSTLSQHKIISSIYRPGLPFLNTKNTFLLHPTIFIFNNS